MSSQTVSKSSNLRGPMFEDDIEVKRASLSTPMETWRVVPSKPIKKDSFQDKNLNSKVSFTLQTENRFACIGDKYSFHIEDTEPDVKELHKPIQKLKKKQKIKKMKKIRKMKKYIITDPIKAISPFDEQEMKRCNKCFVNHFPSLPKFCRWAEEHADKFKKQEMKEETTGTKKINSSSKYIEKIQIRINFIVEQLHSKCAPQHGINVASKFDKCPKKKNLEKSVIQSAKACAKKFFRDKQDKNRMVKYCSQKIKTVMELEKLPDAGEIQSIQSVVQTFNTFFYNQNTTETEISQVDGNFDLEDTNEEVHHLYGVSCENEKLTVWINFLRGFDNIWEAVNKHNLCKLNHKDKSCSFCLLRSLCSRLNHRGTKGPKSLKPFEAAYHLGQMEKNGLDWSSNELRIDVLIEETLQQVRNVVEHLDLMNLVCYSCGAPRGIQMYQTDE